MTKGFIATMFMTAAAAAAIAAAPTASAAAVPTPGIDTDSSTTQGPGSVAIQAEPPAVSDARSYGQYSTPAPFLGD